jgi:hypothetical protein
MVLLKADIKIVYNDWFIFWAALSVVDKAAALYSED